MPPAEPKNAQKLTWPPSAGTDGNVDFASPQHYELCETPPLVIMPLRLCRCRGRRAAAERGMHLGVRSFDMDADPWQLHNVYASANASYKAMLHEQVHQWLACKGKSCL